MIANPADCRGKLVLLDPTVQKTHDVVDIETRCRLKSLFLLILITGILLTQLIVFKDLIIHRIKIRLVDVQAVSDVEPSVGKLLLEFVIVDLDLLFGDL